MRYLSAKLSFFHVLAAIAVLGSSVASMPAPSAEIVHGDKSARTFAAVHAVSRITSPRSAAARSVLLPPVAPAAGEAAAPAPVAPALQSVTDAFNQISLASMHLQGDLLGWAITTQNDRVVDWLLHLRMNPNVRDSGGMTPLLHAIAAEDLCLAERLLAHGADPNAAGPNRVTPVMMAASAGQAAFIEALLENGAHVDAADAKDQRALHYALAARQREALEVLLAAKARVSDPDLFPVAAETRDWSLIGPVLERFTSRAWDAPARVLLKEVVLAKQVDHLRLLLSKHRGSATLEGRKDPMLAFTVVCNDLEHARLLLEAGADPNLTLAGKPEDDLLNLVPQKTLRHYLTFEPGMNLMTVAAGMGHAEMLKLLISHGAEKNRPTKSRHRLVPLYFAAWGNHVECLQILIGKFPTPAEMRIEISLGAQEATLYKNGAPVFRTEISGGKPETPTPTGSFVVTDKKREHRSNLHDNARMPFFMRLSCKDFGLHEGIIPGYPASHGCIRLPGDSARKLFHDVPIGTLVTIR